MDRTRHTGDAGDDNLASAPLPRPTVTVVAPGPGIALAGAIGAAATCGFIVGIVATMNQVTPQARAEGACLAFEFAENYGAVATPQKRQAMRAMVTSASPDLGAFPRTLAEFEEVCGRSLASMVRFGR